MFGKNPEQKITDPGDYAHRIKFQTLKVEANAYSEAVERPDRTFYAWAAYEPRRGSEWPDLGGDKLAGEKRQALSAALFRVPLGCPDIDPATHQIVFQNKTWDIRSVTVMPMGIPVEYHILAQHIA